MTTKNPSKTTLCSIQPSSYTVRLTLDRAIKLKDQIKAIESPSVRGYLLSVTANSEGWLPSDGIPEVDAFGILILEIQAVSERDAYRWIVRLLKRFGLAIDVDNVSPSNA